MKPARGNRRYERELTPEEKEKQRLQSEAMMKKWQEEMEAEKRERERIENVLQMLNIPHHGETIYASELVEVLMDEKKVHEILVKVRNKAFW